MTRRQFEIEFKRLQLQLGMFALRILEDLPEAEDIVQDIFLRVWGQLEDGKEIVNLRQYLYRAVRNEAVRRKEKLNDEIPIEEMEDISQEEIDTSERDARLWAEIDKLPDKCREVFLLSKRDGLSNKEIAETMDISVKTVENQITKAFKRLRSAFTDHGTPVFFLPFL